MVFAMVSSGLPGPFASPAVQSPRARHTVHITALHHRDAAACEKVTALLRRESAVSLPAAGKTNRFPPGRELPG